MMSFYKRPFIQHLLYFMAFMVLLWGINLLSLSIVTFFHFLLDHRFLTIESWVYDRAWELTTLSAILSFVVVSKFLLLKSSDRAPFRQILMSELRLPERKIFVVVATVLICFFTFSTIEKNAITSIDRIRIIINFSGVFVFFSVLTLFIICLNTLIPLSAKKQLLRNFLFSVVFYLMADQTFLYGSNISWFFSAIFLALILLVQMGLKLSETMIFIFVVLGPLLALLGLDPFWGDSFSPWRVSAGPSQLSFVLTLLISIIYVGYKNKRFTREI